jgi:HAD superfamily hydrolase (TIGR01457 family)
VSKPSLDTLQHFLLDMDGTIYLGDRLLDGALEFIQCLRDTGRRYLFFTNNSSHCADQYSDKLNRLGIEATTEDILTAGEATVRYIQSETAYRRLFVLGMPSFEAEVEAAGLTLCDENPDAVLLAFDRSLTYAKIERAGLLLREGLPYIATNPDKVCPTGHGYIPDCGAMAAMFEKATGRTPQYIGKPNPEMARMGMEKIGATAETTAMVGDRLYTDIAMAKASGIASVLVLSGETREADLAQDETRPDYVFASVGELAAALRRQA